MREVDYSLDEKERWLAFVGYQMQLRRLNAAHVSEASDSPEILVDAVTLQSWLTRIMHVTHPAASNETAGQFLDYIGRRSGLLLPRGEGMFAFMHLSFQEYFAACYLVELLTSPDRSTTDDLELSQLPARAKRPDWRETLVLLFELLARWPRGPSALADRLFGPEAGAISADGDDGIEALVQLAAEVSVDPHTRLPPQYQAKLWSACWSWELANQKKNRESRHVFVKVRAVANVLLRLSRNTTGLLARRALML